MNDYLIAEPTAATYDMGLQYDYISEEGAGTSFGLFSEWPACRIFINGTDLSKITEKIRRSSLSFEDLKDTCFYSFIEDMDLSSKDISLSDFLKNLSDFDVSLDGYIYCLYNCTGPEHLIDPVPEFFTEENDLLVRFKENYANNIMRWSDMTDEVRAYWEERKEEIGEFYYIDFE